MICPVCKRDLAPTLSICFTCGAMMNDSVREELETKISISAAPNRRNSGELKPIPTPTIPTVEPPRPRVAPATHTAMTSPSPSAAPPSPITIPPSPITAPPASITPTPSPMPKLRPPAERILTKPTQAKPETGAITPKQTSPTLVGFQAKNAVLPDWRLQLQNSVRQRAISPPTAPVRAAEEIRPTGAGAAAATALKVEPYVESEVAPHQNPRVANALRRIEASRRTFLSENGAPRQVEHPRQSTSTKNRPFNLVSPAPKTTNDAEHVPLSPSRKPTLVSAMRIEKRKYDTNKLPQLPVEETEDQHRIAEARLAGMEIGAKVPFKVARTTQASIPDTTLIDVENDTDDLAPIAMRFNAALFDLIIGGFTGLAVLSPFIISGGDWISVPGILAIAGGVSLVLFLYLTISLAVYGQTFGMRLFSLELIDADENEYPSLHQAAVHSAVFILSLASAGLGFLPIFFNEERRAAHDLVSGTVLVREY